MLEDASATLEKFFWSIFHMATGPWLHSEPQKHFTVDFGRLALDFKCDLNPVPWQFVAIFAHSMLNRVRAGFVGAFEVILENLLGGGIIFVKLRALIPDVAPAA